MILLSMVIMNLSVAAVIEGLAEASKENTGIVSGDQVDFLIEKWKDYDTNASGLISYKDFVFLLYEVPPPLGLGKFTSYYSTRTYMGEVPDYNNNPQEEEKRDDLKSINNLGLQDKYMIHETKQIYIRKSDAIKIFNDYAIPLYEQNVHFKDVAKALIEKIFKKNKLSYDLTDKINRRLKKQWEGKYNALKKFKDDSVKVDTGVMEARNAILKFYRRNKNKQKGRSFAASVFKANKTIYKKVEKEKKHINDSKQFTDARIDNYLLNSEKEEVKNDEDYDVFRMLFSHGPKDRMKSKLNLNEDSYIEKAKSKNKNLKFTWFQEPEKFKIDEEDQEEEESYNIEKEESKQMQNTP